MYKWKNGKIIEMTEAEAEEFKKTEAEALEHEKNREPSTEDRLEALEQAMLEMLGVQNG